MHARSEIRCVIAAVLAGCGDAAAPSDPDDGGSSSASSSAGPSSTAPSTTVSDSSSTPSTDAPSSSGAPESSGSGSTDEAGTTTAGDDTGEACVDDHRVIAYLANWAECPSAEQLAQYSHVVIAFAVSYMWTPEAEICSESCEITPVDGCTGTALAELVTDLHAADVQVLISFGGASMGGVWEGTCGEMTKCWDYCVDQVDHAVEQLTEIVAASGADGIDIDYEYCLHDDAHISFVEDLTTGLRDSLDAAFPGEHKLLTHVPMDSELEVGDPYYEIIANVAPSIDFIMPQYYNGGRSPFTDEGLQSIHEHYGALVDGIFGGDASRVVFGYCIEAGCNPVATQPEALEVTEQFDGWYPDNGGIFFWAHPDDTDGWFSQPFRAHYDRAICGG